MSCKCRVSEINAKRIFGPLSEEVTGRRKRVHKKETVHEKTVVGRAEGKKLPQRLGYRWESNTDLQQILNKEDDTMLNGLIWLRIRSTFLWHVL
jgi:hypothetical protein